MSHLKVKIRNIKKSFGQGESKIEVLKGINLDIEAGEILALTGKSGSGKSTMLSLLAGLDSVDSGDIVIDGNNISQMSEKELANFRATNLGIVFQQFHLISTLTALENVLLPLELLKNYQSDKRQRRRRGVILSSQGRQKLQRAKAEVEYQEKRGNRLTLEELSGRTKISIDTLTKVFAGDNNVDKKTLSSCFLAFGLTF